MLLLEGRSRLGMSRILVIKLGAAGDVVRTTPIFHLMGADDVVWITAPENAPLLAGTHARVLTRPADAAAAGPYDLVLSLEEEHQPLKAIFAALRFRQVIGAYPTAAGVVSYTAELRGWFDMSLISTYDAAEANRLKLANRRSYQEIFSQHSARPFPARSTSCHASMRLISSAILPSQRRPACAGRTSNGLTGRSWRASSTGSGPSTFCRGAPRFLSISVMSLITVLSLPPTACRCMSQSA